MTESEVAVLVELRRGLANGAARRLRERGGISQPEIARASRVSPSAVSRWEAARRTPRGDAARRYVKALSEVASRVDPADDPSVARLKAALTAVGGAD